MEELNRKVARSNTKGLRETTKLLGAIKRAVSMGIRAVRTTVLTPKINAASANSRITKGNLYKNARSQRIFQREGTAKCHLLKGVPLRPHFSPSIGLAVALLRMVATLTSCSGAITNF